MYTLTTTVIERSDVSHVLFYRWKDGTYIVTFVANHPSTASNPSTDCEQIYTFSGMYSGGEEVVGRLCRYTKGGAMILVGVASMHGSVMNEVMSMWNNHIKELEKNA
jgi:hypothetical protein